MRVRSLINLFPPIVVRISRTVGIKPFWSVRKTTTLKEMHRRTENPKVSPIEKTPNRIVLDHVIIDLKAAHCFDANYSVISETSNWPTKELVKGTIPRPIVTPHEYNAGAFTVALSSNGFYHWLIEDLPGVIQMLREEESGRVVIYKNAPKYVLDFLNFFEIEFQEFPRFSRFTQLAIPIGKHEVGEPRRSDMLLLREFFLPKLKIQSVQQKVYISRLNSKRSPNFEGNLQKQLISEGWKIVYLEELDLIDQFSVLKNASAIAGIHGAGLSGLVFAEPGTPIVEMYPYERDIKCYENLAKVTGHRIIRVPFASDAVEIPSQVIASLNIL